MTRSVLVADDSISIHDAVQEALAGLDMTLEIVYDGEEAASFLESNPPDLVIADVHMPGKDGYEVANLAKQAQSELPVILLCGTFESFDAAAFESSRAEACLKKPFVAEDLIEQMTEILGPLPALATAAESTAAESTAAKDTAAKDTEAEDTPDEQAVVEDATAQNTIAIGTMIGDLVEPPAEEENEAEEDSSTGEAEVSEERVSLAIDEVTDSGDEEAVSEEAGEGEEDDASASAEDDVDLPLAATAETPEPLEATEPASEEQSPPAADEDAEDEDEAESTPQLGSLAVQAIEEVGSGEEEPPPAPDRLSDEDVDRIARRVVELAGDGVLREIAWEVVPDLAEVIVRERLDKLESELEQQS